MDEKQRGGAGENSSFRLTCALLSQFLKTNRSYGDLNGIERLYQHPGREKYSNQPPTTMNLFPGSDISAVTRSKSNSKESKCTEFQREKELDAPLTIFYDGKVMVFENFPAMKAKNLMEIASRGKAIAVAGASAAPPQLPPETRGSVDLPVPIARRASLHRFLEKRKDRINNKAPYLVKKMSSDQKEHKSSKLEKKKDAWLALDLGHSLSLNSN